MSAPRLFAIFIIFTFAAFGWVFLGTSIESRTGQADYAGWDSVGALWGGAADADGPALHLGR